MWRPETSAGTAAAIVVRTASGEHTLRPDRIYSLGRDPEADIVVVDPRVSRRHAVLRVENGRWLLEDAGSTNGMFLGAHRVGRVVLDGARHLRLGDAESGPVLALAPAAVPHEPPTMTVGPGSVPFSPAVSAPWSAGEREPTSIMRLPPTVLRIGRGGDNDVVVADLGVSRHHAELRRTAAGGYEIADLASYNGTFVNGVRITAPTPVGDRDLIGIGHATYHLVGLELQEFIDTGEVSLDARHLTVRLPSGKVILDDVTFPLGERCLLAVIGPSGAGKSTLLGALTGMRPATGGTVLYDGRDLYANYAELRHRIGLVPQENILHTQLSARRALGYAAELRFPDDVSRAGRDERVREVLAELSLTQHADTRTVSLSGGQQKRVNVALELLTKPSLLFLDEPTSGLDPGLDLSVMEMMSSLAHDGRTVIVVTHSVANLDVCDRLLVVVPGGRVAYFGPPAAGLRHFRQPGWAQVFRAFEAEPDRDWAGEFRSSTAFLQHVAPAEAAGTPDTRQARPAPAPPRPDRRWSQLSTLVRRYVAVIGSDRNYVAAIALLPIILGVLIRVIPAPNGLRGPSNGYAIQVLLILVMGACLTGVANSVRELVKERPIYTRERAAGLSVSAYLGSKLVVLGTLSAVQAVVLVSIGLLGRPIPPDGAVLGPLPMVELMAAVAVLAVASMTAGLLISAMVSSSDKTMPLLVVVVLLQVVLSGAVFRLNGRVGLEQLAWLSPSRWGLGATAATIDLNAVTPPPPGEAPDPLWTHDAGSWFRDMGLQAALAAAFAGLTGWRLRQTGPGRR